MFAILSSPFTRNTVMKILGNSSLASFLKFLISAAWYLQLGFLLILTLMIGWKLISSNELISHEVAVRLSESRVESLSGEQVVSDVTNPRLLIEDATIKFQHRSNKLLIAYVMLTMWAGFAISLSITFLLRRVFDSLARRQPFVVENARRLKLIAFLLMVSPLLSFIKDILGDWFVRSYFLNNHSAFVLKTDFNLMMLLAGLVLLVVAEIFNLGAKIKEEQELTI